MTKTRTAWLAFLLLVAVSISAVVAMTAGTWQTVATTTTVDAMQTDQTVAQVESVVDDAPAKPANWPEASPRETTDAPPSLILRGAELPAESPPAVPAAMPPTAPGPATNITNRHWHDANAGIKMAATNAQQITPPTAQQMTPPTAQQIKRARDSKAEMRVKRSKAAANAKTCAPPTNAFAGLLRKLNLSPRCPA